VLVRPPVRLGDLIFVGPKKRTAKSRTDGRLPAFKAASGDRAIELFELAVGEFDGDSRDHDASIDPS
jgi:hypothetical protein